MANGRKTGGRDFEPGNKANPHGRPPVPPELKEARSMNQQELERILNMLMYLPFEQVEAIAKDQSSIMIERVAAELLMQASRTGDVTRFDFILNRIIGKVPDQINANVKTRSLQAQLVDVLNGGKDEE